MLSVNCRTWAFNIYSPKSEGGWPLLLHWIKFVIHHIDYKGKLRKGFSFFFPGYKNVINLYRSLCLFVILIVSPYHSANILSIFLSLFFSTVCGVCHDLRSDVESYSWSSICPQEPSKRSGGKCCPPSCLKALYVPHHSSKPFLTWLTLFVSVH